MADPVTSSADMVTLLRQQLGDVAAAKSEALAQQRLVIQAGEGPTYSLSGRAGSESVGMTEYLRYLGDQVKQYAELERTLLEQIIDLEPFQLVEPLRVGGSLIDPYRRGW